MYPIDEGYTYVPEPYVENNVFRTRAPEQAPLPSYADVCGRLPQPFWDGHAQTIACHDRAWAIAFGNLRQPQPGSGLIANFIDTAFNGCTFMWDSAFMMMFAKYAGDTFCFQHTLDNFYARQHKDGFICREISEAAPGGDQFFRHDPSSTGPNVLPWSEWAYFEATGDDSRLAEVFDPLMGYHRWLQKNRTWRDGSYWSTGWGCGMDNQPRQQPGSSPEFSHGHMVWADATMQQLLSADILIRMAERLGRGGEVAFLREERERLNKIVNEQLWDEDTAFYYDLWADGRRNGVKTIGAYWALLAGAVPAERQARFIAHLENEREFKRPHRLPTLSADHPAYRADGGYWLGGVWAPTNYMVMRGLERVGRFPLAHEIALSHVQNVTDVFTSTGTLWENYAPESAAPGAPAKRDFVGWTGLSPIAVLYEYVFGLQPEAAQGRIVWHATLTEHHGVRRYPFAGHTFDLECAARRPGERPHITVRGDAPLTVLLCWDGHTEELHF